MLSVGVHRAAELQGNSWIENKTQQHAVGFVLTVNDLEFDEDSCVQNLFLSDRGVVRSELVKGARSVLSQNYALCLGCRGVSQQCWLGVGRTFRVFLLHLAQDSLWPCTNELS